MVAQQLSVAVDHPAAQARTPVKADEGGRACLDEQTESVLQKSAEENWPGRNLANVYLTDTKSRVKG